jgi:hypothetical protein
METMINGQPAKWPPEIWQRWNTFADAADPKLTVFNGESANFFTPRPYVDRWNRGSKHAGFVYTMQPGNHVCIVEFPL